MSPHNSLSGWYSSPRLAREELKERRQANWAARTPLSLVEVEEAASGCGALALPGPLKRVEVRMCQVQGKHVCRGRETHEQVGKAARRWPDTRAVPALSASTRADAAVMTARVCLHAWT